jgi:hypothetical protein
VLVQPIKDVIDIIYPAGEYLDFFLYGLFICWLHSLNL